MITYILREVGQNCTSTFKQQEGNLGNALSHRSNVMGGAV